MDWPAPRQQLERLEEALEIIDRLLDGERLDYRGRHFRTKRAYLHTRPARRPPLYVSAFYPKAARLAGRLGDGLWTLADPERAPALIEAYRAGADDAGRPPGEILLHVGFSWAPDDELAFAAAQHWRATVPPEFFVDDWHDPVAMQRHAQATVSDEQYRRSAIIGASPEEHAERVREIERVGATIVVLMNLSAAAPLEALRVYGERVLPALRR
jgi:coenzyme F420-dependent glucose-6-phosphate dehydrogenase